MPRDYPKSLCPHLGNQSVFNLGLHLTVWRRERVVSFLSMKRAKVVIYKLKDIFLCYKNCSPADSFE